MYVDKSLAQLLEDGQRHGCVVDEGAALACGSNLSTHDALGVVLDVVLLEEGFERIAIDVECALHDAFRCSCAQCSGLSTLSCEQSYGSEENRLTGARLTRDD